MIRKLSGRHGAALAPPPVPPGVNAPQPGRPNPRAASQAAVQARPAPGGPAAIQAMTEAGIPGQAACDGFADYSVKYQSHRKIIGRLNNRVYGDAAIAVARSAPAGEVLVREFRQLQEIAASQLAPRVVTLYCSAPIEVPAPHDRSRTSRAAAYLMKWIDGFHSKSDKGRFDNTLATLRDTRKDNALADLDALDRYLQTRKTIPDLQVMLELATGRLYLLDPGEKGLGPPGHREHPFIRKWRGLLTGTLQPHQTADLDVQKFD